MANATPSRLGEVNDAGGDTNALFLKVFGGEVLTAFRQSTIMMPLHMVRNVGKGMKSAQFPATGRTTAGYHTVGAELTGNIIKHNERVITIDDKLVAHTFIDDLDDLKNHYEVRGEYSQQLGFALGKVLDENLIRVGLLAARASTTITGLNGGSQLNASAGVETDADILVEALYKCAQTFDEKDVPDDGMRYVALRPAQYYLLIRGAPNLIDRDLSASNGDFAQAKLDFAAGLKVYKSNNIPNSNESSTTGENNTYYGDFSNSVALAWHKSAVGTVKLKELAMKVADDPRRLGTLMVAWNAVGHGILRPESAIEVTKAAA